MKASNTNDAARRPIRMILFVAAGAVSGQTLAYDIPTNLREEDDALRWDSDAPSHNIYEDENYIATVHGGDRFEPIFDNSVYEVVAHDHGIDFTPYSAPFLYVDDGDEERPDDVGELEFDVFELYFELNDTDGDLGIHSIVDGDEWTRLVFEDRNGRELIEVQLSGAMAEQGLTEFFFESAEPTFDELAPAELFARFPAGEYDVEGVTVEGDEIEAETELSSVLPAAPLVYVGDLASAPIEGCADDPDLDPVASLDADGNLPVAWDPVLSSHPEIGTPGDVEVELYQFVFESDSGKLTADLDPDITSFTVPGALVSSGDPVKIEVLVRDATHNQVATEICANVI